MRFHKTKFFLLVIFLFSSAYPTRCCSQLKIRNFVAGENTFLLDGKPFVIRAAELHYPRIPKQYWEHRIKMCKAMGMNTICIYLFWNIHEQRENQFDFTGQNDVAEFVRLIKKNGMYCIVRPGPYVCAEWDMGGLPWWLLKKNDLKPRTLEDGYFIRRTQTFFNRAAQQLSSLQIQNGGNIIMVQVENEYATFGADGKYMERIRDGLRSAGFDKVQLFRCDWPSNFDKYQLTGVTPTLNFGAGSNIDNQFKRFSQIYPSAPKMCSEYWTGWFDHWGKPHETRSVESFIGSLKDMMDKKISFSLYMAHGGTSFGQWGGANAGPYSPMATSYDYNAPIDEQGAPTEKFFAIRSLMANYLQQGEIIPEIPEGVSRISIPEITFVSQAPLFSNLPKPVKSKKILTMENVDQGWGRVLYRTIVKPSVHRRKLTLNEVHDWAIVFLDGKLIGKLDRRRGENTLTIPEMTANGRLDILVEGMGRVNYGKAIADRKGITSTVELTEGATKILLENWDIFRLPNAYRFQTGLRYKKPTPLGLGWYKSSFKLKELGDTFLDMSSWGKGMVWVNGHNMGRFWNIGPQQTLFMPGSWLKKGTNEIIVLDVEGPKNATVNGVMNPILDKINIDESLLHRKAGETLTLKNEVPISQGSFSDFKGWQNAEIRGSKMGRYLCIEVISAQSLKDKMTTIAEIEILGSDGKEINTEKWKIIYADSEEVNMSNSSADKIFDHQESTMWQTSSTGIPSELPHQVVIDLGEVVNVEGFRYLPRTDKKTDGMIKEYRIYLKSTPFGILKKNN